MNAIGTNSVISFDRVTKTYEGTAKPAVDGVTFSVRHGEFFSILGPSGSGKTTILRLIAGFERPDNGLISMGRDVVNDVPPFKRDVRTVFQSYALFPHLTIQENVEYPLKMRGEPKPMRQKKIAETLALVEMSEFVDRMPHSLSGGQRQRAALARSIVSRPRVLLLDEPLAALDLRLRQQMQHTLASLQKELGIAFIYVTHDQGEALSMSDRVMVLNEGRISQLSGPQEIYFAPQTEFVSRFVGRSNLIPVTFVPFKNGFCGQIEGQVFSGLTSTSSHTARMAIRYDAVLIQPVTSGFRKDDAIAGTIEDVLFMGTTCEVNVRCGSLHLIGTIPAIREVQYTVGQSVSIEFDFSNAQVFHE